MLESMLPQTVQNNQLSFGSILKKRSVTLEDEHLQQELDQLFIAQLLDEVISNALYELESRKFTQTSDEDVSDDESDLEVQQRLQEINEQFARMPLPSNRDSRVTFSSHLISVDQFSECLETTVDSSTVCAPVCKAVRIPHVHMDSGSTSDFRSGDGVDANERLPITVTVSFNAVSGARQVRIVQYKTGFQETPNKSSITQKDQQINRLANSSKPTPHVDSGGDIRSPSIVTNHDKSAQSKSPIKNCPSKKSHSNTAFQGTVPSTTKHKGPIWSGDSSRPKTSDTERNVSTTGPVDAWIRQKNRVYCAQRKAEMEHHLRTQEERKQKELADQKERERQLSAWLKSKSIQTHQEQTLKQCQDAERRFFTTAHSKEQCERAYKEWLRKKAREREQQIKEAKARLHVTRQLMRRSKQSAKISAAISQAQVYRLLQPDNNLHTRFLVQG
ncbi:hypothetical protein EG68_08210 [Paragonimus skrjabini miyazakii]|uniref:Coiled-coil domain-containing protein 181 n=1 Tax=Paragonimus skrjabini miyazakii TaxID=59628 RepID=A0A8S9YKN1_9TREM|nr:hypothetical protein EG68_08210 [Paragonimus skrjabini miyazakii]